MQDIRWLKMLSLREKFEQYFPILDLRVFDSETSELIKDIKLYYSEDESREFIDWDNFFKIWRLKYHISDVDPDLVQYVKTICTEVASCDEDIEELEEILLSAKLKHDIDSIFSNNFDIDKVKEKIDEYNKSKSEEDDIAPFDLSRWETEERRGGVPYFLPGLQEPLQGLCKGDFTLVAGYVNVSKTGFAITQAAHTIKHLAGKNDDRPVLYFNSEGLESSIEKRLLAVLNDVSPDAIERNPDKYIKNFRYDYGEDRFRAFKVSGKPISFVDKMCAKYKPALVIIDLLDHLRYSRRGNSHDTFNLERLYQQTREVCNKYCGFICISQANGSVSSFNKITQEQEYQHYVGMNQLSNSSYTKQGTANTLITIGRDSTGDDARYINIAKAKRPVTDAKFPCTFNSITSGYEYER